MFVNTLCPSTLRFYILCVFYIYILHHYRLHAKLSGGAFEADSAVNTASGNHVDYYSYELDR